MESVLRKTEIDLEALKTPTQKLSAFSSYAPRRFHLESESYRSVVRILSYCLDHSLVPSSSPLERALCVRTTTSGQERGDVHLEEACANINEGTPTERQKEGDSYADGKGHEGSSVTETLLGLDIDDFDDEFEACVNSELLSNVISDCGRLIGAPSGELCSAGDSHERKGHVGQQEIVDRDFNTKKTCVHSAAEGVFNLGEVSDVAKVDVNSELLSNIPDYRGLIDVRNREFLLGAQTHDENGQAGPDQIDDNDVEISKAQGHDAEEGISYVGEVCEVAKEDANSKLLNRIVPDCNISMDEPKEKDLRGESCGENEQYDNGGIVENGLGITKACVHDVEEGIFNLGEVSLVAKGDSNSKLLSRTTPNCGRATDRPNGDLQLTSESHDGNGPYGHEDIMDNDPEFTKACVYGAREGNSHVGKGLEFDKGDVNNELHDGVRHNCHKLIGTPRGKRHSSKKLLDGNEHTAHAEIGDSGLKFPEVFHGAEEAISHLGKFIEVSKGDELGKVHPDISEEKLSNPMMELEDRRKRAEGDGNLVSSELVKGANADSSILVGTQEDNSRVEENGEVIEHPMCVHSTSLMDRPDVKNLDKDPMSALVLQIDEEDFEDGEIPDEVQDLEVPADGNDKEGFQGPRRFDFKEVASITTSIHKKEDFEAETGYNTSLPERRVASFDIEADLSETSENDSRDEATQRKQMAMKAREKKRNPLTEERKAKKKIAKKRKRAQKNREQGVKKLKLPVITKPKEVKICNFYLMGRCQQGDLCKYSHDTPLMKSAPCKYFACNSCLKGDDCPYDHDLSKYPCHKYFSTGSCIRGDGCKFSHKIPTTDDTSLLKSSKPDSRSASEQSKLKNQPVRAHVSPICKGPFEGNNKASPSVRHKPLEEANQVPKGICFLSFGAVRTDFTDKFKESLPVKKYHHHSALSVASSGSVGDASSQGLAIKDPGTTNHEVSEATKILEEFLFCGAK